MTTATSGAPGPELDPADVQAELLVDLERAGPLVVVALLVGLVLLLPVLAGIGALALTLGRCR